ncbi:probable jasmonic acid carboxyl methyltransferase 2 [Zingiber officinale]|uniref:probable jasmonic acid carboxyl methyltransferase 2 n=1 Tax=Zingiber officinale TaxID=94328 RepID=UPI001C4C91B7|nr:probable jasmonic acid carboxyl methyltransferase 2 [Zingiber officinale]
MDLKKYFHMNSGAGKNSYASNSKIQGLIICKSQSVRREAAVEAYLGTGWPATMSVADLGCSSGPTALLEVEDIMEAIERECVELRRQPPEFNLLLNDLYGNDFNAVFRSLPEFYSRRPGKGLCFVTGVPGTFYGRLFAAKSLHLVCSSSSLHWLSQMPEELQQKEGSPAACVNKGKVFISAGSPPCVAEAYRKQFHRDFTTFLRCRAEEIVRGGLMVLAFMSRKNREAAMMEDLYIWELLADALNAMASENLVAQERIDSFNAPFYAPSLEELEEEIEGEGSFCIRSSDHFGAGWDDDDLYSATGGAAADGVIRPVRYAVRMEKGVRAVAEWMLRSHFGEGLAMDDLFCRYGELLAKHYADHEAAMTNVVIALVRN